MTELRYWRFNHLRSYKNSRFRMGRDLSKHVRRVARAEDICACYLSCIAVSSFSLSCQYVRRYGIHIMVFRHPQIFSLALAILSSFLFLLVITVCTVCSQYILARYTLYLRQRWWGCIENTERMICGRVRPHVNLFVK